MFRLSMENISGMKAIGGTLLTTLGAFTAQQARPTQETMKQVQQFLNYCASQKSAILTYCKSDMILAVHSNASYLSEANARSRAGGIIISPKTPNFPQTLVQFSISPR